jgi:PAS domain S-box-containing protein
VIRLRVMIVGTSAAETMRVEDALQQTGYLEVFRYIGLEQALDRIPDWDEWDLLIARYQDRTGSTLLSLLAPVLRRSTPPIIFLVDPYDPILVTRLLNANARRVLPVDILEQVITLGLEGVFDMNLASPVQRAKKQYFERTAQGSSFQSSEKLSILDGQFPRLFRTSPIGMAINRLQDGRCLDCNESFARLLESPREELIGRVTLELGLPEEIQQLIEKNAHIPVVDEQLTIQFERKIYTRSRKVRHILVNLDRIEWAGDPCVLSIIQDITEAEQAKEKIKRLNDEMERLVLIRTSALEAANRELAAEISHSKVLEDFSNQLSQIIWETPDVVAISDPDGCMQFLNKAGRALFGLNENEPVSHLDIFFPYSEEMRRWIREEIKPVVVRKGIWRGETAFQLGDGRVIPLSQVLLCKRDDLGEVQFLASIARDVSDFKHVEQELRQSRERYRTLAEAAHDFIFMVSREGLMEYANEYACHALGFDPGRVEGIPASQFFPKSFAENHLHMFSEVQEIDRPIYTEGPFQRDGQEAWLGTWLVPIKSDDGQMSSILGISRDITEQKKTDDALQRSLQNERKLGEMRSNFFSMTSHQFRTPLSTILLSAELLHKYGPRWDDQKRSEHLGRIQDAANRLNSMLEDILVIGRVESGRYVCSPKDFDLIAFCEQSIHEISNNDRNEHELVFKHDVDHLPVYLDPDVMHRVIDNLLSNAIKYSPKSTQVTVKMKMEDYNVLLEVSDHGIGIPERDIKYLFQPFQRGSNAADYPGTGIGLTIIQKSVELLNGNISLKSKEGQGTTFIVRFPPRFESASDRVSS